MNFVDVVLPIPKKNVFTYQTSQDIQNIIGKRVLVPFRKRQLVGVAVKTHQVKPDYAVKPIAQVLDSQAYLSANWLEWLKWAARYYLSPLGEILATALPAPFWKDQTDEQLALKKTNQPVFKDHWTHDQKITPNAEQQKIIDPLKKQVKEKIFFPALIFGITGSGKSEIYLRLIEEVLAHKRQALFLVPEIGLTPQVVALFRQRFDDKLALYHSGLTENQRLQTWLAAYEGKAQVVIGTRSALFLPFQNLGALFLDEEHDGSYKQEDRFRYHARDMAMMRGKTENCLVVLGSATPSLESYTNAQIGKYHLYKLSKRAGPAMMPDIKLIDMAAQQRQKNAGSLLSIELMKALEANLKAQQQSLLLVNRRGFARSFLCMDCQNPAQCPNCSVSLVYHRGKKILLCHYCDYEIAYPQQCPHCQSTQVTLVGFGAESIEEELKSFFPSARIARLDRDTTAKKGVLIKTLKNLKDQKIDILVGTQMIAKGHDVANVTLVGILGLDTSLGLPDFRAAERTFQLLTQVAGRAGRGEVPGKVIVQSYAPNHYSIRTACDQDYEKFYDQEITLRDELSYPPHGRLAQFVFSSTNQSKLNRFMHDFKNQLDGSLPLDAAHLLGPAPAPLEKIRGRYRWQTLIKGKNVSQVQKTSLHLINMLNQMTPSGIKWTIDVDPIGML